VKAQHAVKGTITALIWVARHHQDRDVDIQPPQYVVDTLALGRIDGA